MQVEVGLWAARAAFLGVGLLLLPELLPLCQVTGPPLTVRQSLEAHLAAELAIASHGAGAHLHHVHHAWPQTVDPSCVGLAPGHGRVELIVFLKKSKGIGQWPVPECSTPSPLHPGAPKLHQFLVLLIC